MYSIANEIAYSNKMCHRDASPKNDDFHVWGPSCWIDVRGKTHNQQYVPLQGDAVARLIAYFYQQEQQLPELYVISPFRRVKSCLQAHLRSALKGMGSDSERKKWIDERIGTVHTFQGKAEENVFFVLGADEQKRGSARWAAIKPNLLNVAVTRAKKRVYIIGNVAVWANLEYFNVATNELGAPKQLEEIIQ